ncbi:hypothetical protein [Bradyrhizobium sp.]|uniref:hypothetical protein n=1 Tax=Bradyrhizobium sp. TaxID=376 RepID=UPI0040378008
MRAALLYLIIVFGAGFLLGPIRVLWLEPRIGAFKAVLYEAPLLLGVMLIASRLSPRTAGLELRTDALLAMGGAALAMQQVADIAVGLWLRSISLREQLVRFATAEGAIYAALLVLFAVMPALTNRASR